MGLGTRGLREAGTWGRGTRGRGDAGTRGRGDVWTWDSKTLGLGMSDAGTRGRDKQTINLIFVLNCKVQFSVLLRKILYLSFGL